ncbi:MAG TPA: MarR family transcriptional regulator [Deferrisomatales bacterium]|nr:MarR family transcriptional regulator [Deferrisomatales bacterium]
MTESPKQIEEEILSALRRISRAISLYSSYVQRAHGITGPQLMVLREAERSGEVAVSTLAERVSLSHATVTGILDRLEKRGLAVRIASDKDRRKRVVQMTREGKALLGIAPPLLQSRFLDELRKLKDWEQTLVLSSLQRVSAMMSAEDLSAAPVLMPGEGDASEWASLGVLAEGAREKAEES